MQNKSTLRKHLEACASNMGLTPMPRETNAELSASIVDAIEKLYPRLTK